MSEDTSPLGDLAHEGRRRRAQASREYRDELGRIAPFEKIARALVLRRGELGLTQEDLATKVGTSVPAISRLESGTHAPNLQTLQRVASALAMEVTVQPLAAEGPR